MHRVVLLDIIDQFGEKFIRMGGISPTVTEAYSIFF